jgi:hypothetical protein
MSSNDPVSGRVICDKGCQYPRDAGECLRRQGVPGAGGSFGDWCECECHARQPAPASPEYFGHVGEQLDKLSTDQVSYERYAAEQLVDALDRQRDEIAARRYKEIVRIQACDAVLKRRKT